MTLEKMRDCLAVASKYGNDVSAEHDILYFSGPPKVGRNLQEESDITHLEKLGAHFEDDVESWAAWT